MSALRPALLVVICAALGLAWGALMHLALGESVGATVATGLGAAGLSLAASGIAVVTGFLYPRRPAVFVPTDDVSVLGQHPVWDVLVPVWQRFDPDKPRPALNCAMCYGDARDECIIAKRCLGFDPERGGMFIVQPGEALYLEWDPKRGFRRRESERDG